ncbi:aspartate--tRNA ligase [Candidatus Woesearchaeota archaeon]|nr:aspartate--tRNA ligase [Candidatus Woesearchaeota archaeon]
MLRTHTCGELKRSDEKKKVSLCGWVQSRRDHGNIIFIDLRDRYGITQIVFDPSKEKNAHKKAEKIGREWVIKTEGVVRYRGEGLENKKIPTGEIEVIVNNVEILNESLMPPIEVTDETTAGDEARMKYRYVDLRRPIMKKRIVFRSTMAQEVRKYMTEQKFIEIETPLLIKATPEGARDYVVPSRVNPGKFYALPQSPQLYKQILMIAGMDRYFQLARCLRDEDLRMDRQPEHTQIDVEMSFVEVEDVLTTVEGLMKQLFKTTLNINIQTPFIRIPHETALNEYGSDKPDLRFELKLNDVSDIAKHTEFSVFHSALDKGGVVKMLNATSCATFTRKDLDELIDIAKRHHAQGLAWAKITGGKLESSIAKYINEESQKKIIQRAKAKDGDLILFVADKKKVACTALGQVRLSIAEKTKIKREGFNFCWVTEFPLFEWNEESNKWDPAHHPFCMPLKEHMQLIETDPGKVHCTQYDLVLNGTEMGSGSIRIHKPEIQKQVFNAIGLSQEEAEEKFGFLLNAYNYGGPPHGGIGIGFDRLVAMMLGLTDIREVVAFPKNKKAEGVMDGSPSTISQEQLRELSIKVEGLRK